MGGRKRILLVFAAAAAYLAAGAALYAAVEVSARGFAADFVKDAKRGSSAPEDTDQVRSALTGEFVAKDIAALRPITVMIENLGLPRSPMNGNARPQAGLDRADIVYETLVEGGITRFLALYQSRDADRVMPVRSARPYYVSWAAEYRAAFFRIGGSPEAASLLNSLGSLVFDGGKSGGWFSRYEPWRREGRAVEHTALSSTASMRQVLRNRGAEGNRGFEPFLFKDDLIVDLRPESKTAVDINFSSLSRDIYKVSWRYDKESNSYLRFMAGLPHIDQVTGQQLTVKNVIIQTVINAGTLPSGKSRQDIRVIGSGSGYLLRDGASYPIRWSKADHGSRTLYTMADGTSIVLNRGPTWVIAPIVRGSDIIFR